MNAGSEWCDFPRRPDTRKTMHKFHRIHKIHKSVLRCIGIISCACVLAFEHPVTSQDHVGLLQNEEPVVHEIRIAMCQTRCTDDDREGNLTRLEAALKEAQKLQAHIACFPEMCILGWVNPHAHELAHPIPGTRPDHDVSRLAALARQHRMMICVGLAEKNGQVLHDSVVLIDRDGTLLLKHRKLNILTELMDPPYTPGDKINVAETRYGKIGLLICADTFVEEHLQEMGRLRPDVVLVPYGWAAEPDRWPGHGKALANTVSNAAKTIGAPVIGVDLVGEMTHGPWTGKTYGGQSVASDATGEILAVAADRQADIVTVQVKVRRPR